MTITTPALPHRAMAAATAERADAIRRRIVEMCCGPEGGHAGGALSLADILTCLYFDVLRVDPRTPRDPGRDILLLSKGHGAIALYATLAERGFFPVAELSSFALPDSRLMGHPVRAVPGVEMPTGSLGHGLPLGVGFALAARLQDRDSRTFVVLGDGELQEGSCWESAAVASAQRLDRLVAIVDRNGLQLGGTTEEVVPLEPLARRWDSFGWEVHQVDGHDHAALTKELRSAPWKAGRPSVLIARTSKGHGVPRLAGRVASHYASFTAAQRDRVLASMGAFLRGRP
jgi:transketolase